MVPACWFLPRKVPKLTWYERINFRLELMVHKIIRTYGYGLKQARWSLDDHDHDHHGLSELAEMFFLVGQAIARCLSTTHIQ